MRRAARDVGVALIGFRVILGVSHTVGRAIVPASPLALRCSRSVVPSGSVRRIALIGSRCSDDG